MNFISTIFIALLQSTLQRESKDVFRKQLHLVACVNKWSPPSRSCLCDYLHAAASSSIYTEMWGKNPQKCPKRSPLGVYLALYTHNTRHLLSEAAFTIFALRQPLVLLIKRCNFMTTDIVAVRCHFSRRLFNKTRPLRSTLSWTHLFWALLLIFC